MENGSNGDQLFLVRLIIKFVSEAAWKGLVPDVSRVLEVQQLTFNPQVADSLGDFTGNRDYRFRSSTVMVIGPNFCKQAAV